ncbi:putative CXXCH cytochrome family protein [Thermodesulfitimonas autotrophica]|uniref:Putative CXXCH cytochrome family protein n=1 Tax=Thermodesulfitimonas autotrophica TaxID=1894989 RepID=A0A3N5AA32_9THEO|nr:cytochrome c3 family protein [Thermodesulfitimonas autotrophica]RPF42479.1 putative CXXCH cytochrome family protein [Thermodesulfitimonas autotrophica]
MRFKGFPLLLFLLSAFLGSSMAYQSVPAAAYDNPHGPYDNFPAGCAACHVAHAATGPNLLSRAATNTTALCLTCHDGTGSVFNVVYVTTNQEVYGLGFYDTAAMHFHPVRDMGNPLIGQSIGCTDCHNPHGDMSVPGQVYARLLSAFDGTTRQHQGPNFCLACHGSVDRGFPSVEDPAVSYWVYTLGNHENSRAAHYDTSKAALRPASGTQVTCVMCHNKHAARYARLLPEQGADLCFKCHNSATNSLHHRNIKEEFSVTRASYHDIYGAKTGAVLSCSSCHGPHTAVAAPLVAGGGPSLLADPTNTKAAFSGTTGTGDNGVPYTVGTVTDFCIKCHNPTPPTATASTTTFVPLTIKFPSYTPTTNASGWNKSGYYDSAHHKARLLCTDCHQSHGSDYPLLQRYPEDDPNTDGECLRCHNSSKVLGAPDIKSDLLLAAASHPTLTVTGAHQNTEDYTKLQKRHAECADCHDVHVATKDNAIKGVSGAIPDYTKASLWSIPNSYTFTKEITHEYELCFKCHSFFSYGSTPPTSPSGGFTETDPSVEFNPNNPSYHAVIGESKIATYQYGGQTYYYGKLTGGWSATSPMKCTDCHGSPSGVRGPHGSPNAFILKAPWDPNTDDSGKYGTGGGLVSGGTSSHVCFKCHDYDFYAKETYGNNEQYRSKFSSYLSKDGCNCGYKYNLHALHVGKKGYGCACCHGAIPHGYKNRGILVEKDDPAPYSYGSKLDILTQTLPDPGEWKKDDCAHGMTGSPCHGGM